VGDGRQSLDVTSEQAGENFGLCFTQLRELRGDVGDGTVVLTDLVTDGGAANGRSVPVAGQRTRQGADTVGRVRLRDRLEPVLDLPGASPGELDDGIGAT
jgi:hypothetical protein